jgi:hypothetical protein
MHRIIHHTAVVALLALVAGCGKGGGAAPPRRSSDSARADSAHADSASAAPSSLPQRRTAFAECPAESTGLRAGHDVGPRGQCPISSTVTEPGMIGARRRGLSFVAVLGTSP